LILILNGASANLRPINRHIHFPKLSLYLQVQCPLKGGLKRALKAEMVNEPSPGRILIQFFPQPTALADQSIYPQSRLDSARLS